MKLDIRQGSGFQVKHVKEMIKEDKNKITVEAYDKNPQFYADRFNSYGIKLEDIDRSLKLNESGLNKVLELGCANGKDAKYFISKVGVENYVGIDASENLIKLARENNPKGKFYVKDMRDLNVAPETFGVVFCFASLLHMKREELEKIIERCHKWLKTGGILYISTKFGEYRELETENLGSKKYYYLYQPEDIEKLCPYKFFIVYKNVQDIDKQSWFEIALRKI